MRTVKSFAILLWTLRSIVTADTPVLLDIQNDPVLECEASPTYGQPKDDLFPELDDTCQNSFINTFTGQFKFEFPQLRYKQLSMYELLLLVLQYYEQTLRNDPNEINYGYNYSLEHYSIVVDKPEQSFSSKAVKSVRGGFALQGNELSLLVAEPVTFELETPFPVMKLPFTPQTKCLTLEKLVGRVRSSLSIIDTNIQLLLDVSDESSSDGSIVILENLHRFQTENNPKFHTSSSCHDCLSSTSAGKKNSSPSGYLTAVSYIIVSLLSYLLGQFFSCRHQLKARVSLDTIELYNQYMESVFVDVERLNALQCFDEARKIIKTALQVAYNNRFRTSHDPGTLYHILATTEILAGDKELGLKYMVYAQEIYENSLGLCEETGSLVEDIADLLKSMGRVEEAQVMERKAATYMCTDAGNCANTPPSRSHPEISPLSPYDLMAYKARLLSRAEDLQRVYDQAKAENDEYNVDEEELRAANESEPRMVSPSKSSLTSTSRRATTPVSVKTKTGRLLNKIVGNDVKESGRGVELFVESLLIAEKGQGDNNRNNLESFKENGANKSTEVEVRSNPGVIVLSNRNETNSFKAINSNCEEVVKGLTEEFGNALSTTQSLIKSPAGKLLRESPDCVDDESVAN